MMDLFLGSNLPGKLISAPCMLFLYFVMSLYAVYKQPLEKSLLDNSANGIATSQPTEKIREKKVLLLLAERNSSISPVPTK